MNARRLSAVALLIVLWGAMLSACAPPSLPGAGPGAEVGRGNALFDQQDYAAALEAYTAAAAQLPDSPEVVYNQGVTHYALGDYGEAERLFRQVDRTAQDLGLVAAARYNLGNSKFQQGMAQRESNVQQALSALQASVAFYQGALELTPDDREAARNIEVVRLAIKDILDQLQEQQAQSEVAEQLRDLQQRQEEVAARSAQLANEPPPEAARSEALRQLREEQQQISEETAAAAQQLDKQAGSAQPSGTPSPSGVPEAGDERRQEALQKLQDAQSQQGQAADRLEGQEPQSAATHQRAAAEDIAEALRALHDPNGAGTAGAPQAQDQQQEGEAQGAQGQPEQPVPDTLAQNQQPQDATAAQILDKERRDRAAREQLQRGTLPRTPPVEKNW